MDHSFFERRFGMLWGPCIMFSLKDYHRLAEQVGFRMAAVRDVTRHVVPTLKAIR